MVRAKWPLSDVSSRKVSIWLGIEEALKGQPSDASLSEDTDWASQTARFFHGPQRPALGTSILTVDWERWKRTTKCEPSSSPQKLLRVCEAESCIDPSRHGSNWSQ